MMPLPLPRSPRWIGCFDFDGTLHDPASTPSVPEEFFAEIIRLRERGMMWGINTGREFPYLIEGLHHGNFPFLPDFVVCCERIISFAKPDGTWRDHDEWNARCSREIDELFEHSRELLHAARRRIEGETGANWIALPDDPAGFVARTEEEMEWILREIVQPMALLEPHLGWQHNSIWLRFGHKDFQKGSSLSEVARIFCRNAEHCFAMGDGMNDLAMLKRVHASMIACPKNAVADVRDAVVAEQGYVAQSPYGLGVCEALRHFFS